MKRKLIFLVGASGAGKDTVADYLCRVHGFSKIPSYTTRGMRKGEEQGREHTFIHSWVVDHPEAWCERNDLHCLAYTRFGGEWYWSTVEQVERAQGDIVYIIDEKGLVDLFGHDKSIRQMMDDNFNYEVWQIVRPNNPTDAVRQERDKDRIVLPDSWYDRVIVNDGDLQKLERKVDQTVTRLHD